MGDRPYLVEAEFEDAMGVIHSDEKPAPLTHTIWTGDFMGMCRHDVACPVCFAEKALIMRSVTPGDWRQTVAPCEACQKLGYRIVRLPRWLRKWWPQKALHEPWQLAPNPEDARG